MTNKRAERRQDALARSCCLGLVVLCVAWFWPHGPAGACGSDGKSLRHTNSEYLFSVEPPAGLLCATDPAPSPNHGCGIELDEAGQAVISVLGEYNTLDRASPRDELNAGAGAMLEPGVTLTVLRREATALGGLAAERLTLRVEDPKTSTPRIRDQVVAFREAPRRGEIIYTVEMNTPEARYKRDLAVFERVLASWRTEDAPQE